MSEVRNDEQEEHKYLGQPLWDNKNTEMKHQNLLISAAIISVFFFLFVPRFGLGEHTKNKVYQNETEVRGILAIQVSSPPVWNLKMRRDTPSWGSNHSN